jgi:hypothetical protein
LEQKEFDIYVQEIGRRKHLKLMVRDCSERHRVQGFEEQSAKFTNGKL